MKNLKGDLLTIKEGYICHQVNVEGIMGAGLALQIKKRWPKVYLEYKSLCDNYKSKPLELLGRALSVPINGRLSVINLFGQSLNANKRPTRYDAVADAFERMGPSDLLKKGYTLFIPKWMGCALGGGDWNIYLAIVIRYFPRVNIVEYEFGKDVYYDPDECL